MEEVPGGGRFTDTDWWAPEAGEGEWGQSFGFAKDEKRSVDGKCEGHTV